MGQRFCKELLLSSFHADYITPARLTATLPSPDGERRVEVSWPAGVQGAGQGAGQVRSSRIGTHILYQGGVDSILMINYLNMC